MQPLTDHRNRSKQPTVALADTCQGVFDMFDEAPVDPRQGCLLQIYPATSASQLVRLTNQRTIVGRDSGCDVPINDPSISRHHAAIDLQRGTYSVVDLNSTNGTYLNDQRLRVETQLRGGELIRLGGVILKFMSGTNEEANYHAVVHELMIRDSLTNAFNRSYLIPVIEKELLRCQEQHSECSIILMDIDHFKRINDQHGHLVGDEVLRIFCERIRDELGRSDMLARFGGEEFVVACPNTTLLKAGQLAEALRLAVSSRPFSTQDGAIPVTCSLGVTSSAGMGITNCDQLLSAADAFLYSAKDSGRNCVKLPGPEQPSSEQ